MSLHSKDISEPAIDFKYRFESEHIRFIKNEFICSVQLHTIDMINIDMCYGQLSN